MFYLMFLFWGITEIDLEEDIDLGEEIDLEEAIRNGKAPWNRSRIMVIGPGGVGKTSLIRRLTGKK